MRVPINFQGWKSEVKKSYVIFYQKPIEFTQKWLDKDMIDSHNVFEGSGTFRRGKNVKITWVAGAKMPLLISWGARLFICLVAKIRELVVKHLKYDALLATLRIFLVKPDIFSLKS